MIFICIGHTWIKYIMATITNCMSLHGLRGIHWIKLIPNSNLLTIMYDVQQRIPFKIYLEVPYFHFLGVTPEFQYLTGC